MRRAKHKAKNKGEVQRQRKQVGIHIDVELWRKFRATCMEEGTQAGIKIEELIRDYLNKKEDT